MLAVADPVELAGADLGTAPEVSPPAPEGTNVELVVALGEQATPDGTVGVLRMRVHERGVGETQSCGTGACAAAMAVRTWVGADGAEAWLVEVPGGLVRVRVLPEGRVELAGPAELVATATVDLDALLDGDARV